jgi:hypothetical protein
VDQVEIDDDGARVVYVETADETASACPSCGAFSLSVKRRVSSRPLNIPYGATLTEQRFCGWCGTSGRGGKCTAGAPAGRSPRR